MAEQRKHSVWIPSKSLIDPTLLTLAISCQSVPSAEMNTGHFETSCFITPSQCSSCVGEHFVNVNMCGRVNRCFLLVRLTVWA